MDLGLADAWQPLPTCWIPDCLDTNGAQLLIGWDWAARSLEVGAPDPLIRSISQGTPFPIPTVADAGAQKKNVKKDSDTHTAA